MKSENKINSWINDQYEHPVESSHSIDETLKWFKENNIEYLSSIPNLNYSEFDYNDLFHRNSIGSRLSRILSQVFMNFSKLGNEGGLFIMIGKKN